jgi:hypothetical protein
MAASEWTYEVAKRAEWEISRLPDGIDQDAIDAIEFLLENPTPPFSTKLRGYENAPRPLSRRGTRSVPDSLHRESPPAPYPCVPRQPVPNRLPKDAQSLRIPHRDPGFERW